MMKLRITKAAGGFIIMIAAALISGCRGEKASDERDDNICVLSSDSESGLPFPGMPDSLFSPEDRAAYAVIRFWDALDDVSPALRGDTVFMEQSFANFVAILRYVPEEVCDSAVTRLISRVRPVLSDYTLVAEIARKYLDDPNSPMRSEELFVVFLRRFIADPVLPEAMRLRAADRLDRAMKNRQGTLAADFRLVTRDGRRSTLRREISADTTIVMFYDHDCAHCREITERLIGLGPTLRYRVLAVDVAPDRRGWEASADSLPESWDVAFATDAVDDDEIYYLPALPSFYLIAPDATVLLKDFDI